MVLLKRGQRKSTHEKLSFRWKGPFLIHNANEALGTYEIKELDGAVVQGSWPRDMLRPIPDGYPDALETATPTGWTTQPDWIESIEETGYGPAPERILVICYTNHGLDQFLEDLMDIGISQSSMVRLGSTSTARSQPLGLFEQAPPRTRTKENWDAINRLGEETTVNVAKPNQALAAFETLRASESHALEYLEFSQDDYDGQCMHEQT